MGNGTYKNSTGSVNFSVEELEEMSLEVTHNEGAQLITFILGEEKYGLDILTVRELISSVSYTHLTLPTKRIV